MDLSTTETRILQSIRIASENDPLRPEFPSNDPKFPATPTIEIKVPGFSNVWLKDESVNPTGTHKDRMAWEIIVTYRDFLLAKKRGQLKGDLPRLSIISSGSAAIAIQSQLTKHGLPALKVLVDPSVDNAKVSAMRKLGCELFVTDLGEKSLRWQEILHLTKNPKGFDITSSEALDPTTRFYDWMSYEVVNHSPDYCFVPFGTGNLYENILNITKKEVSTGHHDPRFSGDTERLRRCHFLGATTDNPKSKADKLYSPHLPFVHYDEQWIRLYRSAGFCGSDSNVHLIEESFLDKAMTIAKKNNIEAEYSGIAGLALMLQLKDTLPTNKKMLVINTGKTKYS